MCKISIIVPVYNGEDDIKKCISKLLGQTFQDIEIIIVNDGSTDKTEKICMDFERQDNRVKLYTQKNAGPSVARNKGLEIANGEWIVFVDSDDWLEADCLEYVYRVASEEEDTDIVLWNLQDEQKDIRIPHAPFKGERRVFSGDEVYKIINILFTDKTETKDSSISIKGPTCKLIKKEIIEDCYFPVEFNLGEDVCFAHQVYDRIHKLIYVNKTFYHRILKENSLSLKKDIERGERRSKYANWVLNYRADYDKKILNKFVFIKYKEVALHYMDSRLKLPYELRKQKIEKFLMDVNWKIDFTNLQGCSYRFLLKNRMYFVLYIWGMIKNKFRPAYRRLKGMVIVRKRQIKAGEFN